MEIVKNSFGYTIKINSRTFVKNGLSPNSLVKIWKTRKGAENYIKKTI